MKPEDANFRSTQYTLFVNAVSDYLTERFPELKPLTTRAYLFLTEPSAVKPRAGFVTSYCPYIKNHKRPVFDTTINERWHDKVERFRAAGIPLTALYEYYLCSTTPRFYHAIAEVAQQDFKFYGSDLQGVYLDAPAHDSGVTRWQFDISAIEFWVISRLMWNPGIDVQQARREYCRRAYREAAAPMIRYFERLGENYRSDPAGCYWNDDPISACKHYIIDKGLTDFVRRELDEALKLAQHPGSRRLIELHRDRMLEMIDEAIKAPERITLAVPQVAKAPLSGDPTTAEWQSAAVIPAFTRISDATKPPHRETSVRLLHDKENLYLAFRLALPDARAGFEAGKYPAVPGACDWSSLVGPTIEMFVDGDLKGIGSYYQLAFAINGNRYSGKGAAMTAEDPPVWSMARTVAEHHWNALPSLQRTMRGFSLCGVIVPPAPPSVRRSTCGWGRFITVPSATVKRLLTALMRQLTRPTPQSGCVKPPPSGWRCCASVNSPPKIQLSCLLRSRER